ncbi:MAG: dephospho-CoA kinase [Clostridia bacterium]|nr:dephospho-CoA kinase [Clostridia bacterium]
MAKTHIAITGGIGSGKSLVLQFLREWNYPVFSCDELYKQVILSPEYIEKIEKLFPSTINDGKIDRKILSEIVFNNEENLKQLNALAHPLIMDLLMKNMKATECELAFAEVPLLFEGNFEKLFDKVVYIARDKNERIDAILKRDGISQAAAEKRILNQFDGMSEEGQLRLKNCNANIITNDGSIEGLKSKILQLLNKS